MGDYKYEKISSKILLPVTILGIIAIWGSLFNGINLYKLRIENEKLTALTGQSTISGDELMSNTDKLQRLIVFEALYPENTELYDEEFEYCLGQLPKHMGYILGCYATTIKKGITKNEG